MIQINPTRIDARRREAIGVFLASDGWRDFLNTAEEEVIRPLRIKLLTDAQLDPREQTGAVRALAALRKMIESPYKKLAVAAGKTADEMIPPEITRLFT